MEICVFQREAKSKALFVAQVGREACSPGYGYGPRVRDIFLIHFVCEGCGTLHCGGETLRVQAGQGFLIRPGEEARYQADVDAPWHYAWVGYAGEQAGAMTRQAGLGEGRRVFTAPDAPKAWQVLGDMLQEGQNAPLGQVAATGNLLRFLGCIAPQEGMGLRSGAQEPYCEKAMWYFEEHFERNVSVKEAADFVGLSRSQLYRVMCRQMQRSPKALLQEIRLRHARRLLATTQLSREEIALRIGMQSGAQLGKMFKAAQGMTPLQYRQAAQGGPEKREDEAE